MKDNKYWLEGTFTLTDSGKMQEMNELILDILKKTGIGRLTTKKVNGKKIPVFKQAAPDKNGIVKFDFSMFEKIKRKGNYYNTNTGELVTPDRGNDHFGLMMNMIMTVLEAYSETPCYYMFNDCLANVKPMATIIEEITGKVLNLSRRARAFDTTVYFKQKGFKDFMYEFWMFPLKYYDGNCLQLLYMLCDITMPIANYKENQGQDRKLAFQCFKLLKTKEDLKDEALEYIIKLMDMTLEERIAERKKKHPLDFIAGVAEFLPAPYLVQIYSEAFNIDFFELWFQIGKEGYWDVTGSKERVKKTRDFTNTHFLSSLYQMKNEDDFIGIWYRDDMIISSTMTDDLEMYKRTYFQLAEDSLDGFDTISELISCMDDLTFFWDKKRYIDCNLLEEIIKNKNNICYKKVVYILRKLINDEIQMFSELTEQQIRKWILKKVNWEYYADMYWHYLDVLSNRPRRKELLGF